LNLWLMSYHILPTNSDTKMTFTLKCQTIVNSYANIQRTFRTLEMPFHFQKCLNLVFVMYKCYAYLKASSGIENLP
jgi:hypothetical protein